MEAQTTFRLIKWAGLIDSLSTSTGVDFMLIAERKAYSNYLAWMEENSDYTPLPESDWLTGHADRSEIVRMWLNI